MGVGKGKSKGGPVPYRAVAESGDGGGGKGKGNGSTVGGAISLLCDSDSEGSSSDGIHSAVSPPPPPPPPPAAAAASSHSPPALSASAEKLLRGRKKRLRRKVKKAQLNNGITMQRRMKTAVRITGASPGTITRLEGLGDSDSDPDSVDDVVHGVDMSQRLSSQPNVTPVKGVANTGAREGQTKGKGEG